MDLLLKARLLLQFVRFLPNDGGCWAKTQPNKVAVGSNWPTAMVKEIYRGHSVKVIKVYCGKRIVLTREFMYMLPCGSLNRSLNMLLNAIFSVVTTKKY